MRVQLSPWEVSKTSIQVPSNKSRQVRKLSTTDDENDVSTSNVNGYHDRIEFPSSYYSENDDDDNCYRFAARFVEHSRKSARSWKKRGKSALDTYDVLPSIVVTSEHQIRMIGKSASSSLSESININLTSPLGKDTSFLPVALGSVENGLNGISNGHYSKLSNGKHKKQASHNIKKPVTSITQGLHSEDNHETVSAVYDNSMDIIFALQRRRTKLACWRGESSSFVDELASVTLNQPATSISLLQVSRQHNNNSIVVGSCSDGSVFFAQVDAVKQGKEAVSDVTTNNKNNLSLQYLPTISKEKLKNSQFVGQLFFIAPTTKTRNENTVARTSGSKRKILNSDNNSIDSVSVLILYRFYIERDTLDIVKNEIEIDKEGKISLEKSQISGGNSVVVSANLGNILSQNDSMCPVRVVVAGFGEGRKSACIFIEQRSTSTVSARAKANGNTIPGQTENCGTRQFYFNISLENGLVFGVPVDLPFNTKKVSMVGSSILAVETHCQSIVFFDLARGSKLFSQSVSSVAKCDTDTSAMDWFSLYTDTQRSRIALLYVKRGSLYIACSTIVTEYKSSNLDDRRSANVLMLSSGRVPLAHGLMTLFAGENNATKLAEYNTNTNRQPVIQISMRSGLEVKEGTISSARATINAAIGLVRNSLLDSLDRLHLKNGKSSERPLHLLEAFAKAIELVSDCHDAPNDSEPQTFVDGIIQVFCQYITKISTSTLQQQKLSMLDKQRLSGIQSVLQICVRTCKFSCRQHLQGLFNVGFSMGLLKEGHVDPSSSNSPVELLLDILDTCSDVSERQQVIFLRYMMSIAKPADIASSFQQERLKPIDQRCIELSHQYDSINKSANSPIANEKQRNRINQLLIIAGVDTIVDKVCKLSDVNESLLRASINDELENEEIQLLYQLFTKALKADTISTSTDPTSGYRRKLQWVNSLQALQQQSQQHKLTTRMISSEVDAIERIMSLNEIRREFDSNAKSKSRSLSSSSRMMNSFDDSYIVEIL
jgi:hypothetical protein